MFHTAPNNFAHWLVSYRGIKALLAGFGFATLGLSSSYAACPTSPNPSGSTVTNQLASGNCGDYLNQGTITDAGGSTDAFRVGSGSAATYDTFTNEFIIRSSDNGRAVLLNNSSTINTFNNFGLIDATANSGNAHALEINTGSTINVLNNRGALSSAYFDAIQSSGVIGTFNNSGVVDGGIRNAGVINLISNTNTIRGRSGAGSAAINNVNNGYVASIINSGIIQGVTSADNAIVFGSNATNQSTLTNTGTIIGQIQSGLMNGVTINQNAGSITGAINLSAANSVINMSGGSITGNIDLSGSTANIMNLFAGNIFGDINFAGASVNELNIRTGEPSIFGNITNTIPNLTMNVDGAFLTQGNIGTGASPIKALNVNANGYFIQQIGTDVYALNTNINYDGIYSQLGNGVTLNSNLNVNEGGMIAVLDSGWQANINGALTMASGSAAFIPIGLATASDYGKIVSNQPLNIANGSFIVAPLDPSQNPALGTVLRGVIQGNGAPAQAGQMVVLNSNSRYQFQAQWDGNGVNLVLPNRKTADYNAVMGSGCASSSVSLSGNLGNFSGYSPGCGGTNGTGGVYDGALARQTLQSISAVQGPTQGLMHQRYAVLNAAMEYDCKTFDSHGFCLSFQARATGFGSQATGSGVFNIAFRPVDQLRLGVFLDYQVTAGNPVMNGIYGAGWVSNGSVVAGYDNPTFGGYVGFSQSGYSNRVINTGIQAFLSGGYNPGKISITRAMMLDPYGGGFVDSQPGTGTASLNSYFYRGLVGYGFSMTDKLTFMPYGGMRITDVTRGGYMEGYNSIVQQPLIFNSFGEHLFTGFGGGMLNGQITENLGTLIGLGAEADISRTADNFTGGSPVQIERMRTFGFAHTGACNGIRPTGTVGAYYDVAKNQRIMLNGYAGQQAWSSRGFATGMLGYQVAF